jgi:hypothetical protein
MNIAIATSHGSSRRVSSGDGSWAKAEVFVDTAYEFICKTRDGTALRGTLY